MKCFKRISTILMAALVLLGLVIGAKNTFAANYGIVYSGGQELSTSNVTVDTSLSDLTALFDGGTVSYSSSSKWETIYRKSNGTCQADPIKMIRVWDDNRVGSSDDIWFKLADTQYDVKIKINSIALEGLGGLSKNGNNVAVVAATSLYAGYTGTHDGMPLFKDAGCSQPVERLINPSPSDGQRIFVNTTITLHKHNSDQIATLNDLYFGITDIDAAQSYRIMNSSVAMSGNLYAMNNAALSTTGDYNPNGLRNMLVSNKKYIYSEYSSSGAIFNSPNINNIYLKINTTAQTEGLNIVFGFARSAGSSVRYYTWKYTVTYVSDSNGTISGKTSESVFSGNNPTGSSSSPKTGYEFKRWTADKKVTLTDGTTIAAGQPLTSAQVKKVVVKSNLKFTAIHETIQLAVNYTSDNNGSITGKTSETVNYGSNPTGSESAPKTGYEFDRWTVNKDVTLTSGRNIAAGETITDAQIKKVVTTQALTFTAHHKPIQYTVNYVSDDYGVISGIEGETVAYHNNPTGSSTTPNEGYKLSYWTVDKAVTLTDGTTIAAGGKITAAQIKNVVVDQSLTFTAHHDTIKYNVTYVSDDNGVISGIEGETVAYKNNPTGSESDPNPGFVFDHWIADKDVTLNNGDVVPAGEPVTPEEAVVTEALEFTAIHRDVRLSVTYTSDEHGEISGKTNEVVIPNNNPTGSESTPEAGFVFSHWIADKDVILDDGTEIAAGLPMDDEEVVRVVVTQPLQFTAIHEDVRLNVTYVSDEHGEISGKTNEIVIPNDSPTGSESTPEAGFVFDHWIADKDVTLIGGDIVPAGEPVIPEQAVVTEDLEFTAIHRDVRLNVVYTSDEHGRITGQTGEVVIPNDNPTGSESKPEDRYVFDHWIADNDVTLEDGTEIVAGEPMTDEQITRVIVDKNLVFTAVHVERKIRITYDSDENGTISGKTEETLVSGDNASGSQSSPKNTYTLSHWIADKDIELDDGTIIKAGDPIAPEQLEHAVLYEDTNFTAIHKAKTPDTPNTGLFSSGVFGQGEITVSIVALSIIAVLIKLIPMIFRKRISFDK